MRTRFYAMAGALCFLLPLNTRAADQWWDTTNGNGLNSGNNPWDTSTLTWATTASPGTATPVAWANGNNAFFAIYGAATITVNGVTANALNFSQGTEYVFKRGTGALTINGGLTNTYNGPIRFETDVTLGNSQTWHQNVNTTTVTGKVSAASYTLTKTGDGTLVFTNAANQFAGFAVKAGTLRAFNNSLGNSSSTAVTLSGADAASRLATVNLNTRVAGNNPFAIGNLTVAGGAGLVLNTSVASSTNILSAQTLARTGRGTLGIIPSSATALGAGSQAHFTGGTTLVNGMLAPWLMSIPNASAATFATYDAVKGLVPVTYDTGAWTSTKKISVSTTPTLNTDTEVYALQVYNNSGANNVTVNSTLTLGDGVFAGLAMNNGGLLGSGTLAFGTAELIVGIGNSDVSRIGLILSGSGGLTLNCPLTQALVISNMTYTGDTWINGGTLRVAPTGTTTYTNTINGVGILSKTGPGTLILTGNSVFNGAVLPSSGTLVFDGNTWTNYTASKIVGTGAQMMIRNGAKVKIPLALGGVGLEGTRNTLTVVGGELPGVVSVLDVAGGSLTIGSNAGSGLVSTGNVVRVDGNGVVDSAVLTNANWITVGGTYPAGGTFSNGLAIVNGGKVVSSTTITVGAANSAGYNWLTVSNATLLSNASTIGDGCSGNTATIQAGGYWSTRGNSLTVGKTAATRNVVSVQSDGILEANTLATGGTVGQGNRITNSGGVYQFTTATPTITTNGGFGSIAISDGVISFRGVASGLNINNNTDATRLGRLAWSGNNALRLNNAIADNTLMGGYTFQTGTPANYSRLEMINGTTKILGQGITVGATGSILFSNTTATIGGAYSNSGTMTVVDSLVSFGMNCVLQGGSIVWSINAASSNLVAVAGSLTSSGSINLDATSVVAGRPSQVALFTVTGTINDAATWTVTPSSYKVSRQGQTLSLVPRYGTVIAVR